jgi:hypothetical protein
MCSISKGVASHISKAAEKGWHQKRAGIRKMLAPEKCWHQKNAGTRKMLTPEVLWHQKNADTGSALASEKAYCRSLERVAVREREQCGYHREAEKMVRISVNSEIGV